MSRWPFWQEAATPWDPKNVLGCLTASKAWYSAWLSFGRWTCRGASWSLLQASQLQNLLFRSINIMEDVCLQFTWCLLRNGDLKEANWRQKSKVGVLVCLGRRQLFHATQLLFQLQSDGNLQLRLFPHHDGGHCAGICGSSCRTQHGSCKRLASYVCDHMPLLRCPSSIAMILSI